MRIANINIENFRNITKADVVFGKINIFTGRNSSGKSNLLLALASCLKTDADFSDVFYDNVVTYQKGKSKAIFKTTVVDMNSTIIYADKSSSTYFKPSMYRFENTFGKKGSSPIHQSLFYTGEFCKVKNNEDNNTGLPRINDFMISENKKKIEDQLVYDNSFEKDKIEKGENEKYIENNADEDFEDSYKYFDIFKNYQKSVYSWVDQKIFSSTSIYNYVTKRIDNNDIYEQVLNRLKTVDEKNNYSQTPLSKAEFIHVLADVQKNEKQLNEFYRDLDLYTKGLVNKIYINTEGKVGNKGEIRVESPHAPRDIFCISAGTAVLVYFILLKNWLELMPDKRSYIKPDIMLMDEIDSIIHPSLMGEITEILRSISKYVQLFVSTHSPDFIDCFEKDEVFWLKDINSIDQKTKDRSMSSIYSYKDIVERIPENKEYFANKNNSELFIDGLIDSIFPLI